MRKKAYKLLDSGKWVYTPDRTSGEDLMVFNTHFSFCNPWSGDLRRVHSFEQVIPIQLGG